ncbi:FkbM family methyltransferase [Chloroflexota bacterium]
MESYFEDKWQKMDKDEPNISKFLSIGKKICLYDLGSAGGIPPPFCWIAEGIDLVNFEPDLRSNSDVTGNTMPVAIGTKGMRKIYLNQRKYTSSLLKPYRPIINRYDFSRIFKNGGDIFHTVETVDVDTYGLDEIIKLRNLPLPDFLKIDVQGLSLEVLETAERCLLESVIGVQIEVEFLEIYEGQKTFDVIHRHLYKMGFEIFRLSNLNKWYYKTSLPLKLYSGQHIFCDLLYLRSIDSLENKYHFWNTERATKAVKLFLLYDLTDTAAAFLEKMTSKNIIPVEKARDLKIMVVEWEGALRNFYIHKEQTRDIWKRRILDFNLRKLLHLYRHSLARLRDHL